MKRGFRILLAIIAIISIILLWSLLSVYMGWKQHGGYAFGALMLAIITFVWKKIAGKKPKESIDEDITIPDAESSNNQPEEVALNGNELLDQQKKVTIQQDGIAVSIVLSSDIIEQMERIKEQEPNKWKDNDVELVREAKKQLEFEAAEKKKNKNAEEINANTPIVSTEPTKPEFKKIELKQNGITVSMELSRKILEQMEIIRRENPQNWFDNEVELVKTAKKRMQETVKLEDSERMGTNSSEEKWVQSETSSNPIIETQSFQGVFGDKLESEYRREAKADAHWIRQDDTEICINIEESVYRKMVELQSENPKKWVNKELDLFKKAKSILLEQSSPNKSFFRRK